MAVTTEIALSRFLLNGGNLQCNHFLVKDDEPLFYHIGVRGMHAEVREAVSKLINTSRSAEPRHPQVRSESSVGSIPRPLMTGSWVGRPGLRKTLPVPPTTRSCALAETQNSRACLSAAVDGFQEPDLPCGNSRTALLTESVMLARWAMLLWGSMKTL